MALKAELPVFSGGVYPPQPKNQNTPPWKFWSFPLPGHNQEGDKY